MTHGRRHFQLCAVILAMLMGGCVEGDPLEGRYSASCRLYNKRRAGCDPSSSSVEDCTALLEEIGSSDGIICATKERALIECYAVTYCDHADDRQEICADEIEDVEEACGRPPSDFETR